MQDVPKCILYELANIISKSRFLNHKRVMKKSVNVMTLRTMAPVFTQNHRLGQLVVDKVGSG